MEREVKRLKRLLRRSERWITRMTAYVLKIQQRLKVEKAYYNDLKKQLKEFEKKVK